MSKVPVQFVEPILANCEIVGKQISESDDLARSLSRLFSTGSPWREKLGEGRCFARYAVVLDAGERRAAAAALKDWLISQRDSPSRIFDEPGLRPPAVAVVEEEEAVTVAERAVDRVLRGREHYKAVPAGF